MSRRQRRMRDKQSRHSGVARPSPRRIATAAGLTLGASLAVGSAAQAAMFTVSNVTDADPGSLRAAIDQANINPDLDRIDFAPGLSGIIELATALPSIGHSVDIVGPGARSLTIDANGNSNVFVVTGGPTTIAGLTLTGGDTGGAGGAIVNVGADLTVSESTITGNSSSGGGGILAAYSSLTVERSTISGNTLTSGRGGGISGYSADVTIADSTISGNSSPNDGGGVFAYQGLLTITGSTIVGNSADGNGGGIFEDYGTGSLNNSVVSGNHSPQAGEEDVALRHGASLSAAFSLVQVPGDVTTDESDIWGVDPQLAGLANNGGPTDTMLPALTSPVVNKGKAFGLSADQRGLVRPVAFPGVAVSSASGADASDIGAVELQMPAPVKPTTTTTPAPPAATPAPADPFSDAAVLGDLMKGLGSPKFTAGGKSLTFTTSFLEPGSALFGLDVSFYRGTGPAHIARVHKPIHLGKASTTVTAAGQVRVSIPIGPRERRILKRHRRAKLVVRTYFTTAVAKHHLNTSRVVKPARRPR